MPKLLVNTIQIPENLYYFLIVGEILPNYFIVIKYYLLFQILQRCLHCIGLIVKLAVITFSSFMLSRTLQLSLFKPVSLQCSNCSDVYICYLRWPYLHIWIYRNSGKSCKPCNLRRIS